MLAAELAALLLQNPDRVVKVQVSAECACPVVAAVVGFDDQKGEAILVLNVNESEWSFTPEILLNEPEQA